MEENSTKSKVHPGSGTKNGPTPENVQTIKAVLPILSIIKGLYDACGVPMQGPAATSGIPELPLWGRNICEQLRLTIFKRVLELRPAGEKTDWRNFGRMLGVCQRLAAYLKSGRAETDHLLEQVEEAFIDSMDVALAQKAQSQSEYLSGVAEGYEMFLDAQGQFVGDRGRTAIYFELLSRWQEIEAMRQSNPPPTCIDLYQEIAPSVGDKHWERFGWFKDVCDGLGLRMKKPGRPRKNSRK